MNKDSYMEEYAHGDEELRKIKRSIEYQSWVGINEAAINIQKVFKGVLEKDFLIKILEDKYQSDMKEPSLKL